MDGEMKFAGVGVSPGVAMAPAFIYRPAALDLPKALIADDGAEAEWSRLSAARDATARAIRRALDALDLETSGGESGILEAHLMALDDEMFVGELREEIFGRRHNAEWAVSNVASRYVERMRSSGNEILAERAVDIRDVGQRVLKALMGVAEAPPFDFRGRRIVVAENLTPSETLALPRDRVAGVALDRSGATSHAALLIRAIGIPAVFGLGDFSKRVSDGETVALDGNGGAAISSPGADETGRLRTLEAERSGLMEVALGRAAEPAVTPDGFPVEFLANVECAGDVSQIAQFGGAGVGLFRTEYLWLSEGRPVAEDRQAEIYTAMARELGDRPLAIRAFDLGGDKFRGGAGMGEHEENPFLGLRSIRFLLRHEDLFKIQIRAILRAGAATGKRIDFTIPMVSDLSEVVKTRELVRESADDLRRGGIECVEPRIGIMVEVPSAALAARVLARYCDYFSIGTNDLTQYTMAADRCGKDVAHLCQPLHPAVLRLIQMTVEAARSASIGVAVCGEMAANPLSAIALLGLGVGTLSMAPAAIPIVKETMRRVPRQEAGRVAKILDGAATAAQMRHFARGILARFAPEILRQC